MYSMSVGSGRATRIAAATMGGGTHHDVHALPDGRLACIRSTLLDPPECYVVDTAQGVRPLARLSGFAPGQEAVGVAGDRAHRRALDRRRDDPGLDHEAQGRGCEEAGAVVDYHRRPDRHERGRLALALERAARGGAGLHGRAPQNPKTPNVAFLNEFMKLCIFNVLAYFLDFLVKNMEQSLRGKANSNNKMSCKRSLHI